VLSWQGIVVKNLQPPSFILWWIAYPYDSHAIFFFYVHLNGLAFLLMLPTGFKTYEKHQWFFA